MFLLPRAEKTENGGQLRVALRERRCDFGSPRLREFQAERTCVVALAALQEAARLQASDDAHGSGVRKVKDAAELFDSFARVRGDGV